MDVLRGGGVGFVYVPPPLGEASSQDDTPQRGPCKHKINMTRSHSNMSHGQKHMGKVRQAASCSSWVPYIFPQICSQA